MNRDCSRALVCIIHTAVFFASGLIVIAVAMLFLVTR